MRKEYFQTWSRIRKIGSAGMWTDYSFHGVVRVSLTEKVIVEQGFGGGEGESFRGHCHHCVDIIMLSVLLGKALCKWCLDTADREETNNRHLSWHLRLTCPQRRDAGPIPDHAGPLCREEKPWGPHSHFIWKSKHSVSRTCHSQGSITLWRAKNKNQNKKKKQPQRSPEDGVLFSA